MRCADCHKVSSTSFTVCADGVARCLACGAKSTGQLFRDSVAHSRRILKAYGPLPRWRDKCNQEYIP